MSDRASERIAEWLDDRLNALQPGTRLPTIKQAAALLLASERSVERVYRRYRENGLLVGIRGRGVFKADTRPLRERSVAQPRQPSYHNLAAIICKSIGDGTLMRGQPLPQVKYMALKYRVGALTVEKAYHRLIEMGYVTKMGKTFWVGSFDSLVRAKPDKPIYLLKHQTDDFSDIFENDMLSRSYRRMDQELAAAGFFLRFDSTDNLPSIWSRISQAKEFPYGLIAYRTNMDNYEEDFERIRELAKKIRQLSGDDVPVLLDWELGGIFNKIPRGISILSRGHISTSAAKAVARHIAGAHHRRVALFVNHGQTIWHIHAISGLVKIWTEAKGQSNDVDFTFVLKPPGSTNHEVFLGQFHSIVSRPPDSNYLRKYSDSQSLSTSLERNTVVADDFEETFHDNRKSDLWLFSSGKDAATAVVWCRTHGVSVPRDTAILSLDTDPQCYRFGISFCSPDWEKIGYAMAHSLTGVFPVEKTTKGFIRTEAHTVERTTTK